MVSVSPFYIRMFTLYNADERLDGSTRTTFQATATNSYATHSLLATVMVVRSIIAAAAQPAFARVADVFGRVELLVFSVVLYVLGAPLRVDRLQP